MESKARLLGHSLHQILIVFPLGLLTTSVGFDVIGLMTRESRWLATSYYMLLAGILGGVAAIIAGLIDYRAIPEGTRARRVARWHGVSGVTTTALFTWSAYVRAPDPLRFHTLGFCLSFAAVAVAGLAGWLGGELVTRMGIGVADDAHLDAAASRLIR